MQFSETSTNKRPIRCPVHGTRVYVQRFVMPDPGEYFVAQYVCGYCEPANATAFLSLRVDDSPANRKG